MIMVLYCAASSIFEHRKQLAQAISPAGLRDGVGHEQAPHPEKSPIIISRYDDLKLELPHKPA
jgi:hypothetical protein